MLKVYKYPEIQDKVKYYSGDILFGLQVILNNKCEYFAKNGNNSEIISFDAVKINTNLIEIERVTLDETLILTDIDRFLYYLDVSRDFDKKLDEGLYYFQFTNSIEIFKTEIVEVVTSNILVTFDIEFSDSTVQKLYHDIDTEIDLITKSDEIDTLEYSHNNVDWFTASVPITFNKFNMSYWRVSSYVTGTTGTAIIKGKKT